MALCRAIRARALALLLGGFSVSACGRPEHAPPPAPPPAATSEIPDGGVVLNGTPGDGPPTCGGQKIAAVTHPPNLYLVVDRSGSMGESIDESGVQKYAAARAAIGTLLDAVGSRVRYGAAVFPATDLDQSCSAGRQIFPPSLGDAPSATPLSGRGPILSDLLARLAGFKPGGATPTAATLHALAPGLSKLADTTYVLLVTDGAPNCDSNARCTSAACIPDIEGAPVGDGRICGQQVSCCNASLFAGAGANCIDADATEAEVLALAQAGVQTFVVGMPGSEAYTSLLDRLALAGGTARSGTPRYFAVSDAAALSDALLQIGTGIPIPCDVTLASVPDNPDLVNLYFDGELIPRDAADGWDYSSESALSLAGTACSTVRSGAVREVEIVYGCQTIVR